MSETKTIPLSRGMFATVDAVDFDWLSQWKWSALKVVKAGKDRWYAVRMTRKGEIEGKAKMILMHRAITAAPAGKVVDHRDNDGLNNRRKNVRVCTQSENMMNSLGHADRISRYKGVSRPNKNGKWCASFRGKHLGMFASEVEAATAYDVAALRFAPKFAQTNIKEAA